MGRPSRIDQDPQLAEFVAERLVDGYTKDEAADAVGEAFPPRPDARTITRWKQHPKVRAHVSRLREERTNRITSKIDTRLLGLIETPEALEKLSIKELIEIRRELLPPPAQRHVVSRGVDESAALADLMSRLQNDPKLAEALGLGGLPELEPGDDEGDSETDEAPTASALDES
jgi:hypothetical protein